MYVLSKTTCSNCGSYIQVLAYKDTDENGKDMAVVDCGQCITCGKINNI